jgi:hypothetical protein
MTCNRTKYDRRPLMMMHAKVSPVATFAAAHTVLCRLLYSSAFAPATSGSWLRKGASDGSLIVDAAPIHETREDETRTKKENDGSYFFNRLSDDRNDE